MVRPLLIALTLSLLITACADESVHNCVRRDLDPDVRIRACTAIIEGKHSEENRSVAYSNRGIAYLDKGEVDLAISDFTKSIEIDPKNASAYVNLCNVFAARGELDLAISKAKLDELLAATE
jgi:Tfp pilus assembly protein PilF